jgi:hypothetical protein
MMVLENIKVTPMIRLSVKVKSSNQPSAVPSTVNKSELKPVTVTLSWKRPTSFCGYRSRPSRNKRNMMPMWATCRMNSASCTRPAPEGPSTMPSTM